MPHRLTLVEMTEHIRQRKLSPVELVDAHLRQIAKLNPYLNAFVMQFSEEAKTTANQPAAGVLHGIPVTVKDSFDMQGLPTLCGSRFRLDHVAREDSTAVARLKAEGAIILGKTNCPEFLANWETDNFITGRTNNPWDLDRTAGGSSGGESAAIASFCSAGGIGSDGGGSIRIPAHFCGIAGLKPTPGRVPATGHFPEISHPGGLLGVAGPMARTVADVKLLFEVLSGHDPLDPFSAPVPVRKLSIENQCIGVVEQFLDEPVEECMRTAVTKAARLLASSGFTTDRFLPAGLEEARELWRFFFVELAAPFTRDVVKRKQADAHWTGTELMDMTDPNRIITGREVVENLGVRDRMRAALMQQMKRYPVLLMPVCATTAFPHGKRSWEIDDHKLGLLDLMSPVTPWNLLGMPSLVVPMDVTPEGLPIGVQIVGRPYEEELLLHIGEALETARGPFAAPTLAGFASKS
ncbi:MAG TPA: amidase [Bryobacteraceae bacterium]|nr:amidase [Bryobacteraceae bacterium]